MYGCCMVEAYSAGRIPNPAKCSILDACLGSEYISESLIKYPTKDWLFIR